MYRNTYVEIDTNVIENNIKNIIKKNSDYKYYIGVVKGNAYGHGMEFCKWIIKNGINYLAVSTLDEALEIRDTVSKEIPILILQPIDLSYIDVCITNNITVTISSYEYYKELKKKNVKGLKVHLKLNTGMNRLGISNEKEVSEIYNYLINSDIILEGIYTHIATLGILDKRFDNQVNRFLELTKNIDLNKIKIVHLYSSNAFIIHPKLSWANGVRLGIIMYGLAPRNINYHGINKLKVIRRNLKRKFLHLSEINNDFSIDVNTCLKLVSEVVEIHEVNSNEFVGYGSNYETVDKTMVAIIPVGYMDGLSLYNKGRNVYINNTEYEIIGVINMGMITVKVDDKVKIGDRVEVIKDIRKEAAFTKTTPHQYLTSISPLLERKYLTKEK